MTVSRVGLVTHTEDDFEEPFSMPFTLPQPRTGAAIHILMLVGNLVFGTTIVKRDPKSMTQENLTGSDAPMGG